MQFISAQNKLLYTGQIISDVIHKVMLSEEIWIPEWAEPPNFISVQ